MNDVIQQNRTLLRKKLTPRERIKEANQKINTTGEGQTLEHVEARVRHALKTNPKKERITRITALTVIGSLIVAAITVMLITDFKVHLKPPPDMSVTFPAKWYPQGPPEDEVMLKVERFRGASTAAKTMFKNGHKHQGSESYYGAGQTFRTAWYHYDTLITETYYYKSGKPITNFPDLSANKVHHLDIVDEESNIGMVFDFYDGKIIGGTYNEYPIQP